MTIASNLIAPFRSLLRPSSHKLSSFNPPPPVFPLAETPSQIARAPSLSLLSTNLPPASERAKRPAATPPSTLELVLHLLLLEAIYALVSSITDGPVRTYWMDNAVRRFEVWFPAMMTAIVADNAAGNGDLIPQMEGMPHLQPPLDVMMVWHTFLLNPGWYEDAIKKAYPDDPAIVKQVLGQEFPWFWIRDSINPNTLKYHLPPPAVHWFTSLFPALEPVSPTSSTPLLPSAHHLSTPLCPSCHPPIPLTSAVITPHCIPTAIPRQFSFITKMHTHLFLRSPVLIGTLRRATVRCLSFFDLFRLYPGEIMVPTLDVDLVWHTQLLGSARYRAFCESLERAGRWINHDDGIEGGVLGDRFEETGRRYREVTGGKEGEWGRCLDWGCEVKRERAEQEREGKTLEAVKLGGEKSGKKRRREEVEKVEREREISWRDRVVVEFWRQVEQARRKEEELGLDKDGLQQVLDAGIPRG